jgi:hypothetical protein
VVALACPSPVPLVPQVAMADMPPAGVAIATATATNAAARRLPLGRSS